MHTTTCESFIAIRWIVSAPVGQPCLLQLAHINFLKFWNHRGHVYNLWKFHRNRMNGVCSYTGHTHTDTQTLIYTRLSKKTSTTLSMLCRTANWSLFKKKPMSENARCGRSRTSKLENWCHSFWPPKQVCNPLAIDVAAITFTCMRYSFILNEVRFAVFECSERLLVAFDMYSPRQALTSSTQPHHIPYPFERQAATCQKFVFDFAELSLFLSFLPEDLNSKRK